MRENNMSLTAQVRADEPNQKAMRTRSSSAKFCFTATDQNFKKQTQSKEVSTPKPFGSCIHVCNKITFKM